MTPGVRLHAASQLAARNRTITINQAMDALQAVAEAHGRDEPGQFYVRTEVAGQDTVVVMARGVVITAWLHQSGTEGEVAS